MRKIILASKSPWRKTILEKIGIAFDVEESGYEEDLGLKLPPRALAMKLASGKAEAVAARHPEAIVIGADTFVVHGENIFGKPHTKQRARTMLTALSGTWHTIITGFAIVDAKKGKRVKRSIETRVHFRRMTPREIQAYVDSGEPLGVAGAYAIQGKAGMFIDRIEGDYWNIVGLPLSAVIMELRKFGIGI